MYEKRQLFKLETKMIGVSQFEETNMLFILTVVKYWFNGVFHFRKFGAKVVYSYPCLSNVINTV